MAEVLGLGVTHYPGAHGPRRADGDGADEDARERPRAGEALRLEQVLRDRPPLTRRRPARARGRVQSGARQRQGRPHMEFEYSKKTKMYVEQLTDFMNKDVYPNEKVFHDQLNSEPTRWRVPPIIEELKAKARERGLWNLFLPESGRGAGLTNLEYAPLCEIMGRSPIASEAFNCSAPDTGNMEVLERYGTPEQKKQWLEPLLEGKIRSAFAMTEPKVASSDATNIESSIVRDGAHRSEEHTSELQSRSDLVCRLLLEKKKKTVQIYSSI